MLGAAETAKWPSWEGFDPVPYLFLAIALVLLLATLQGLRSGELRFTAGSPKRSQVPFTYWTWIFIYTFAWLLMIYFAVDYWVIAVSS